MIPQLQGFDEYMAQLMKDWNAPGICVGVVQGEELVFAKGYGYRDYGQKIPFTPATLHPIASNTKLFTAVAAGMLVEEGKLTWDEPVSKSVPGIEFYNDDLYKSVTVRDMLSHRTGITRHDLIWYKSDFTRKELFERLKYLEPQAPIRTKFLYNNLMYAAVGYLIELQSGKTWEAFLQERIFAPLGMQNTVFTIAEMRKQAEYGVPFTERRDSFDLYQIPYYEDTEGVAPCGAIISTIEDMSRWLIALMHDGKFAGQQIMPTNVLKATLEPAMALPNLLSDTKDYWEILNAVSGMGRSSHVYRGHFKTYHGGDLNGFHSQVAFLPREKIGVIVFVIGDHCASLYNTISDNVLERLLGLSETPWSQRRLEERLQNKQAGKEKRAKAGGNRVNETSPSHTLADYVAEYENPAYGVLKIGIQDNQLQFDFRKLQFPLTHYHYERFDTPDDEYYGKFSVNFSTNPQGDVDKATMSLDQSEVVFTRKPETIAPDIFKQLAGEYETPDKYVLKVIYREDRGLSIAVPAMPEAKLLPYKGLVFRHEHFSDLTLEFLRENGQIAALKQSDPSGELTFPRKPSQ